ncbi:hypothetical protein P168DRAFT_54762 [Aspergillus campestris IBT 28561]|uniref:DUF7924 domain-containing protein n=1 Tax=Aspergillus campestris (strain IBT 28561) TaxID=1392248 RepID=A0A2I1CVS1_ASPC2|nr:uncharacterized protein P168DRAFT_54762 [Aspergillus campestris IBT 28561]PKY01711.1 hypothetical protein P168DRAFT_54762 [Aspergillus campestris IBT 28561]
MKRSHSCSPGASEKRYKRVPAAACLTHDALKEHDRNTQSLSPLTLLDMAPEERCSSLSDVPIIPPPSTRSSQRSRSSSPSRPNDAQYRGGPLRRANIRVDEEIPVDISDYSTNIVFNVLDSDDDHLKKISQKLWEKSKELVKNASGETEWTEALYTAIDELRPTGLAIASNRDWRVDLKPPVHNPLPMIPRKRNQSQQTLPRNRMTDNLHPSPHSLHRVESTIPIFKLKDPRPDICVGLSDDSLSGFLGTEGGRGAAQNFLFDLQDTSTLISDPHVTPLNLRFPFLIIELKSGATGGNLYQAQNQAAVGASTALQILKNLAELRDTQDLDDENREGVEESRESTQAMTSITSNMVFSITTEGPIHELWLHFRRPNKYDFYMVCLGIWRTTLKHGSLDFLRHLSAILKWGNGEFRNSIQGILPGIMTNLVFDHIV